MNEQGFPVTSRFRILANPNVLPGKCAVCGATDRAVIDFDATIPMYGAILICMNCMTEAAQGIGMATREDFTELQETLAQSMNEHLAFHGLIGVPRDRYSDIVVAVSGLSDALLFSDISDSVMVAGPHGEIQPPLPLDTPTGEPESTDDIQSTVGSPKQNHNSIIG